MFSALMRNPFSMILNIYRTIREIFQLLVCIWIWCPLYDRKFLCAVSLKCESLAHCILHTSRCYRQLLQWYLDPSQNRQVRSVAFPGYMNVFYVCLSLENSVRERNTNQVLVLHLNEHTQASFLLAKRGGQ